MAQTLGLVGLGLMGSAFAERLLAAGHSVIGFDLDAARLEAAQKIGVRPAGSAREVAEQGDILLVSVSTTAAVEDVVAGPRSVIAAGPQPGKVVVDLSTTELATTVRLANRLEEKARVAFVDAPVSGGPDAARAGTLAIMAGGADEAIARVEPTLRQLGRLTHMGPVGAGQVTKLVNQAIVLTTFCALAEGLRLAEAHGVNTRLIPEALDSGFAGSNLLKVAFPRMVDRDFAPRAKVRQVLKDLELLNADACAHHLAMPMASQALTLYRLLAASGRGDLDAGAVLMLLPEIGAESAGAAPADGASAGGAS